MIKVAPMDDELAIGHEGRIAWINAPMNQREFDRLMSSSSSQAGMSMLDRPSRLSQLAAHAEMSPTEYARKHSMMGVLRVAGRHGETYAHGAVEGEPFNRRLGMLTQKAGAYICRACVEDDLRKRQVSWYRREHHVHGMDWCPFHRQTLWRITGSNPWVGMPHHWIESGEIEKVSEIEPDDTSMAFLSRYAGITRLLLDRERPLGIREMGHLISKRAQDLGLRLSLLGRKATISDHIRQCAPKRWLETYFEDIATQDKLSFVPKIDGSAKSRSIPAPGATYGVVLAAFFDLAQEAISYLEMDVKPELVNHVKTPRVRESTFWRGDIWSVYVNCGGQTKKMAHLLGMDRAHLQERMWTLGMPSLHNVEFSASWRALVRFHDGESFPRSCELEIVAMSEVEALQRKASPQSVALAKEIIIRAQKEMTITTKSTSPIVTEFDMPVKSAPPVASQGFNRFIGAAFDDQDPTWETEEDVLSPTLVKLHCTTLESALID